jgi:hypothetical protein
MLLIVAGSLWLVCWSLQRLPRVNRQLQSKTAEMSILANAVEQLDREVEQMKQDWDAEEARRTEAEFNDSRATLFAGREEVVAWQLEIERQARALDFEASVQLGTPVPYAEAEQKLSLHQAIVEIQPTTASRSTNSAYQRLLAFTRSLETPKRRMDIVELSATGSSNSVRQARAVVQLWSQERSK